MWLLEADAQLQEILEDGTCIIKTNEGEERVEEARQTSDIRVASRRVPARTQE